jgi:two-component system CheB/CheR fusion protein
VATEAAQIDDAEGLGLLLEYLKANRGFDFTGYKHSSLERRIGKRMEAAKTLSYADYIDFLEVNPEEYAELFDTILINVTSFFRDAPAWAELSEKVLPEMLARKGTDAPIRVWCAGCASGEEAYSAAIALAEILGADAFRERVKIYGTDVDEGALATARQGAYEQKALADVPSEIVGRYFETSGTRRVFRVDMRRSVIFGRNDLVQDAPISRVDLLICRNTLMYFTAETQSNILRRFHFAVADTGVLFLGKSEMLVTRGKLFAPVDLKRRIFSKLPRALPTRTRLQFTAPPPADDDVGDEAHGAGETSPARDEAFDAALVATIVVDHDGSLAAVSAEARSLFALNEADIGRPLQDLEVSYRPLDLRTNIERAYTERRSVKAGIVDWSHDGGDERKLEVAVTPLLSADLVLGASVTFTDITRHHTLEADLQKSRRELETAYEELQSTVEELETTNEELQSTNEELETTNEELQSTNEELETMNEELQSTNEELETINDELRIRTTELNDVNTFLEAILTSLHVGVIVLDAEQRVRIWNARAEELWGLRSEEVDGEHVLSLDIGLPVQSLRASIRAVLAGEVEASEDVVAATNRRGRAIECSVRSLPLAPDGAVTGVIMLLEDRDAAADDGAVSDGAAVPAAGD